MIRKLLVLATLCAALAQARVFELRTYHCLPGRLEALKARFRNHTTKLFEKHGIENIGYWVPQDPEKSKNTLIYIVAHRTRTPPPRPGQRSAPTRTGSRRARNRRKTARSWRKWKASTSTQWISPS